jgi:hypothetical protein
MQSARSGPASGPIALPSVLLSLPPLAREFFGRRFLQTRTERQHRQKHPHHTPTAPTAPVAMAAASAAAAAAADSKGHDTGRVVPMMIDAMAGGGVADAAAAECAAAGEEFASRFGSAVPPPPSAGETAALHATGLLPSAQLFVRQCYRWFMHVCAADESRALVERSGARAVVTAALAHDRGIPPPGFAIPKPAGQLHRMKAANDGLSIAVR